MTGQANCRGLNHRVAQGFEHPTHGPFPPGLGWGWRSLWSCCIWSPWSGPSCDSQQLAQPHASSEEPQPHASSAEPQLQASSAEPQPHASSAEPQPHASSAEPQLQAGGAPAPCRACAALSQPGTEVVLEGPGVEEFCPFLGWSYTGPRARPVLRLAWRQCFNTKLQV